MLTQNLAILKNLLKISRPGWWIVSVWLYLAPTGQQWHLLQSTRFWVGFVYVLCPMCIIVYGLNDIVDISTDKDNPRKGNFLFGAKCTKFQLTEALKIGCYLNFAFLAYLASVVENPVVFLLVCALAFAVNAVYNIEPFRFSSRSPLELPTVTIGYSIVSVLSSLINDVPLASPKYWLHTVLTCICAQLCTEVVDVKYDSAVGRRTTAVVLGRDRTLWLFQIMLVLKLAVVWVLFEDRVLQVSHLLTVIVFPIFAIWKSPTEQTRDDVPKRKHAMLMMLKILSGSYVAVQVWLNGSFVG